VEFSKSFGVGKEYSQAAVDKYMAAGAVQVIDPRRSSSTRAALRAFLTDRRHLHGLHRLAGLRLANWTKPDAEPRLHPGVTAGQRDEWMLSNASGTGPYSLERFDKATANVVLKANPATGAGRRQDQAEAPDRHRASDA
jgi:hypothetical protein